MATKPNDEAAVVDAGCKIAEIMQYSCVPKRGTDGRPTIHCVPIPRLFRICPDRPAVEVTRVLNIDDTTGYVEMPRELGYVSLYHICM
ncbi:hypothetical protein R3P38DRAFT_2979822 [Favolaschia claudopus]|uniref:Uncharacterized protein n=1 Tax=Favolaschia claudopus TaxID=2862362 RepID=A0AAW0B149_9AGAR